MNTDVEQLLREGMERYTADLRAPAGLTYRVANAGPICRTTKVLATADQNMVTTEGQAEMLGCLMLVPAPSSKVTVLDKDPNLLKVRIIAPNLESDGYQGWTDVQTLGSEPDIVK